MTENPPTPEQTPEEAWEQRSEERAERLAEKVQEDAHAQTVRVEERAEKLVEQHAKDRVVERAEGRADVRSELAEITAAIGTLIDHMDQSIPADRVQAVLDAALQEERTSRKRLAVAVIGPIVVVFVFVLMSLVQSRSNGDLLENASKVAGYVENCLQHPEKLTLEQKTDLCGAGINSQGFFISYLNCAFILPLAERTEARLSSCVTKAVEANTPSTTTTR
jgi:hypothetical protein